MTDGLCRRLGVYGCRAATVFFLGGGGHVIKLNAIKSTCEEGAGGLKNQSKCDFARCGLRVIQRQGEK